MSPTLSLAGPVNVPIDSTLLKIPANQQPTCAAPGAAVPTYLTIGTLYTFKQAGDDIAPHAHDDGQTHYTIVLSGALTYSEEGSEDLLLTAGALILVPATVVHGFVAGVAGSVCLNLVASAFDLTAAQAQVADIQAQITALQAQIAGVATLATATG
jgi:quercetin dioxygenase-like cupin family protein